jgi:hypothetical protein
MKPFPVKAFARVSLALACCLAAACAEDEPVDVTGTYNLNLTQTATNDCMMRDWMAGKTTSGVAFTILPNANDSSLATGRIDNPIVAALVRLWLGTADFTGKVKGASIELKSLGGNATREGACSYTPVAYFSGTLNKDTLDGTFRIQFDTNGDAACGYRNGCRSVQTFNGLRPPKP